MNEGAGQVKTGVRGETGIRWDDVHRRIADAGLQVLETTSPSPERCHAILKARARVLREPARKTLDSKNRIMVVEFDIAGELYAVENRYVREVVPLREFTPIPGTPPFILGVIAVRGRIVSLMDLRRCFGLTPTGLVNGARAIVMADDHMEFAIMADRVIGLRTISMDSVQLSVTSLTGTGADYLLGVAPDGLTIFDGGKILSDKGIIVRNGEGR